MVERDEIDHNQDELMESAEADEEEFEFIEPMVFDLVRGLGSKVGESEVNYLMIIPLNGEAIQFSPEYEVVYQSHQVYKSYFLDLSISIFNVLTVTY